MKRGDILKVSYTGSIGNTLIETTDEATAKKGGIYDKERLYRPAIIIAGEGQILPGLDKALGTLNVGDKKKLHLEAKDAFGERSFKLIQLVPLREFKKQGVNPFPGMVFDVDGRPARVQSVSGGRVRVDFNHPLAGKAVDYELKVEAVAKTEDDKIRFLLERSFRNDALKYTVSRAGDKKKIVVDTTPVKTHKLYHIMRVIFMTEADKYLGIKEVEYEDGTPKPEKKEAPNAEEPAKKEESAETKDTPAKK